MYKDLKIYKGQILITTLILLMLISITVIVISVTVARNNKEVFNNLEYERSYNSAEGKLISVAEKLADPKLDLALITTTGSANPLGDLGGSCSQLNTSKYYCSFEEVEKDVTEGNQQGSAGSTRRTIVTIEESNEVIGYEIGSDEYFDVVLFKNKADSGYQGKLSIEWIGESGLELELISETNNGRVRSVQEVVDNTGKIYTSTGSHSYGILKNKRITASKGVNSIEVDLNSAKVGANAKLRYLRVRSVNNQTGTALTIKPIQDTSLPKQVRRIESFSYQSEGVESSSPVVITQLPLSPAVISPLTKVASYTSIRQPVCGNGVKEGAEKCDDGNQINGDSCPSTCQGCRYLLAGIELCEFGGCYLQFGADILNQVVGQDYLGYIQQVTKSTVDNKGTDMLIMSGIGWAYPGNMEAFTYYAENKRAVLVVDDAGGWGNAGPSYVNPYGIYFTVGNSYAAPTQVSPTDDTLPQFSGLKKMGASTGSDIIFRPDGPKSDLVKSFKCQYRFPNGDCNWAYVEFINGGQLSVIGTLGSFGWGFTSAEMTQTARDFLTVMAKGMCGSE